MKLMIKVVLFVFFFLVFSYIPMAFYHASSQEPKTPLFLAEMLARTERYANIASIKAFIDQLVAQVRGLL